MPLQETSGAASYDAFGSSGPIVPAYIEEVFSTWLYTGNGSTQTITNGIDLAGKGGLTIGKIRNLAGGPFQWYDTARGATKVLESSSTAAQTTVADGVTAFNSNGITIGANSNINFNTYNFVNWTFREKAKFFDVVTYTGDGTTNRQIAHNLGSVPGMVVFKKTSNTGNWVVWQRSIPNGAYTQAYLRLNATFDTNSLGDYGYSLVPTSTVLNAPRHTNTGNTDDSVNVAGETYVAYLFAHNAGGFGLTGNDNVISCGSVVGAGGSGTTVTLGYEPQWILIKNASNSQDWWVVDSMRGLVALTSSSAALRPNLSDAETAGFNIQPTATGFTNFVMTSGETYIYIAIRRGPMKVPTTGTSVFSPNTAIGTAFITTNFPVDASISSGTGVSTGATWGSRLQGTKRYLSSYNTDAEGAFGGNGWGFSNNTGLNQQLYGGSTPSVFWNFQRAPSFFDVVCYTGTGGTGVRTVTHNLTVAPELLIIKERSFGGSNWIVGSSGAGWTKSGTLNTTGSFTTADVFLDTAPTSTVFSVRAASGSVNETGRDFVAYLFTSCPGVSKVGSYTGNGSNQTINCGFTGGARFVMVKRTDGTGNWMVVDTARGLVSAGDPTLYLNSTPAEVIGVDWLDPDSSGFIVNQEGTMNANVNAATYIFLAIA